MALAADTRIGQYEIQRAIGAGGMGEVYQAIDTRLGRDVALKVLPAPMAEDPDRRARFEREARTPAALNHRNIAIVHGFEDAVAVHALVMELIEGPTLADRIVQGPIPLDEALAIARQIAEAIDAAHQHGIVHRDLKPGNVKVCSDGTVKVLDFGLAKEWDPPSTIAFDALTVDSPAVTQFGVILGTAAYMAPEQARGRAIDRRRTSGPSGAYSSRCWPAAAPSVLTTSLQAWRRPSSGSPTGKPFAAGRVPRRLSAALLDIPMESHAFPFECQMKWMGGQSMRARVCPSNLSRPRLEAGPARALPPQCDERIDSRRSARGNVGRCEGHQEEK